MRRRAFGIFHGASPIEVPSIEQLPGVLEKLPTLVPGVTAPFPTVDLTLPPSPASKGFRAETETVPLAQLVQGSLRLLLAPQSTQLPHATPDPRTLAVQRHVNFWLTHYGHAPVPEDGRMSPLLCGAFALLDQGLPDDYEHAATLGARGYLHDRGMGYTALFGMHGTEGRLLQDGCVMAGSFEIPVVVRGPGIGAETGAGLPPPPSSQAPSIDSLVEAAAREVRLSPRVDASAPPIDTGWGSLTLPPGSPIPAKAPPSGGGGTVPSGGGLTIPDKWPGGVPAKPKPTEPPAPPAQRTVTASANTSLVLVALGVAAFAALVMSGKKKR